MLRRLASPSWAVAEYLWYPLLLIVATPWFLRQLGTEQFGHWMLLTSIIGLGGILSSGTGSATIKLVSASIGRGDPLDAGRVVRASLAIAMLAGTGLALVLAIAFHVGGGALFARMGDPSLLRLTAMAAIVLLWLEQVDNVFSSALRGAERFGPAAQLEIAAKTVQVLAAAIALQVSPHILTLYAVLLVVSLARLFAKGLIVSRSLGLGHMGPSLEGARRLLAYSSWGWLQGIGGVLFGVADRMLVGSLLGAASLAYFSVASQLAMQIHALPAAALSVIFPAVSRMKESDRKSGLWRIVVLSAVASLLLSTAIAAFLLLLGKGVLNFWVGDQVAEPAGQVMPWLAVAYWLLALNVVPCYVLLGIGRIRYVGLTVLAAGVAATIAMYLAVGRLGLAGSPVGRGVFALVTLSLALPLVAQLARERRASRLDPVSGPATPSENLP